MKYLKYIIVIVVTIVVCFFLFGEKNLVKKITKSKKDDEGKPWLVKVRKGSNDSSVSLLTNSLIVYVVPERKISIDGDGFKVYDQIYISGINGEGELKILDESNNNSSPSWNPKTGEIFFTSDRDGKPNIYKIILGDSVPTQLTYSSFQSSNPSVSPDGKFVLYENSIPIDTNGNTRREIFIMNTDGSNQVNVTNDTAFFNGSPAWRPNGQGFVFNKGTTYLYRRRRVNIFQLYYQKMRLGRLQGTPVSVTRGNNACNCNPAWLNDSVIVYESDINGNNNIYSIKINGSDFEQLTFNESDRKPAVSPDRMHVIYQTKVVFPLDNVETEDLCIFNSVLRTSDIIAGPTFRKDPSWSPILKISNQLLVKILTSGDEDHI